jgi:hypothetical protein
LLKTGFCAGRLEAAGYGRQDARRYELVVMRSCARRAGARQRLAA